MGANLDRFTPGALTSVVSGAGCTTGGLYKVFFWKYSEMDWAATQTANQFNTTTNQFSGLTPVATKVIYDFGIDIESAKIENQLINEVFYETKVSITVNGKNQELWDLVNNLKNLCGDLCMAVLGNDQNIQHVGVMRNVANDGFQQVYQPLVLSEDLDTSGIPGEKSREEMVFMCRSEYKPLRSVMTLANYTALLTAA